VKSSQRVMSIEPFPGGRVVHHLKGGRPHITIQVGDVLAAALRASNHPSHADRVAVSARRGESNRSLV
jgi:hypothetical protein